MLCLTAMLGGCATIGPNDPSDQTYDPTRTADLEFAKGHAKSSLFRASMESFKVCKTEACNRYRYLVQLLWTTPDAVIRKVPAGTVVLVAAADAGYANMHRRCHATFRFEVESDHAYQVKLTNSFEAEYCVLTVQDKASGAFLRIDRIN